jgi:hypothetical protein
MKALFARLMRWLLQVRQPERRQRPARRPAPPPPPPRKVTNSTTTLAAAPHKKPVQQFRRLVVVKFTDVAMLTYILGDNRYCLAYPLTKVGYTRAMIAVQRWHDADCNFDVQACVEMAATINELADELCEGKGF